MKDLQIENELKTIHTLSSASGIVIKNNYCYVIADDLLDLGIFPLHPKNINFTGTSIPLFPGKLPEDPIERKKQKPDLETLTYIDSYFLDNKNSWGLIAFPSGSKTNRNTGLIVLFHNDEYLPHNTLLFDCTPLYQNLIKNIADLNIEGSTIKNNELKLFQRGNAKQSKNSIITLDLPTVIQDIFQQQKINPKSIIDIKNYELGSIHSSPLSFSDADFSAIDRNIYFLATAENTTSTYHDGEYLGSILGSINSQGVVNGLWSLDCPYKPEGLFLTYSEQTKKISFYIVTDSDNPSIASKIYQGLIPKLN